jgi:hypothetical protein
MRFPAGALLLVSVGATSRRGGLGSTGDPAGSSRRRGLGSAITSAPADPDPDVRAGEVKRLPGTYGNPADDAKLALVRICEDWPDAELVIIEDSGHTGSTTVRTACATRPTACTRRSPQAPPADTGPSARP